jgi:hypothetical protein
MPCFRSLLVITFLLSSFFAPVWAQRAPVGPPTLPPDASDHGELEAAMKQRSDIQREKKRFEEMKRDSQKLLELATELKQYVDKSGEAILSLEVIRKAEEMEKLSRQVKNNMRGD